MRKTISLLLMILVVAYSYCSFADSLPSEYVMAGDDMATNNGDVFPVVDDSWFTDDSLLGGFSMSTVYRMSFVLKMVAWLI